MKQALSKRQKAVLEVMSKPKNPAEIRGQIGLSRANNISSTLKQLIDLNLIRCLNSKAKTGKLYGLTKRGENLRKILLKEKSMPFNYAEPHLNWPLYGWVICGRQKRAILKALSAPMSLRYIKDKAHNYNPRISRENANDILQLFVKKEIALKQRQGVRVIFTLTKQGEKIRNQLLIP